MKNESTSIFVDLKSYLKSHQITLETLLNISNSNIQNKSFNITYAINILKKSNNISVLNEIYSNLGVFKKELLETVINTIEPQIINDVTLNNLLEFNKTLLKRGLKYEGLLSLKTIRRGNKSLEFYKQLYEISIGNYYYLTALKCLKVIQKFNYTLCIKDKQQFQDEINFLKVNNFKEEKDFNKFFEESINENYMFEIEDFNLKEDGECSNFKEEECLKEIPDEEKIFLKKIFENKNKYIPSSDILKNLIKHDIQFEADDGRLKILEYKYENLKDKVDTQIRNIKKEKKKEVSSFIIKPQETKQIKKKFEKKQTKIDYFSENYHKYRVYLNNTYTVNPFNLNDYKKRLKIYKEACEEHNFEKIKDKEFLIKNIESIKEDIEKLKLKIKEAPPKLKQLIIPNEIETGTATEINESWRSLPPVEIKAQPEFFTPKKDFVFNPHKKTQKDFASQFMSSFKVSKGSGEDFAEIRRKHFTENKETKEAEKKTKDKKQNSVYKSWRE